MAKITWFLIHKHTHMMWCRRQYTCAQWKHWDAMRWHFRLTTNIPNMKLLVSMRQRNLRLTQNVCLEQHEMLPTHNTHSRIHFEFTNCKVYNSILTSSIFACGMQNMPSRYSHHFNTLLDLLFPPGANLHTVSCCIYNFLTLANSSLSQLIIVLCK